VEIDETASESLQATKWSEMQEQIASPIERVWHRQDNLDISPGEELCPDYDL
jgi:hypothetical protein